MVSSTWLWSTPKAHHCHHEVEWMCLKIGHTQLWSFFIPIESMYGIYGNIGGILMVNVTIYSIHGSYGIWENHEKS